MKECIIQKNTRYQEIWINLNYPHNTRNIQDITDAIIK